MNWSNSSILHRLFSHKLTVTMLIFFGGLLLFLSFTQLSDREQSGVSLKDIRLTSWSLTQFRTEAHMFDRSLFLAGTELADTTSLTIHYNILWSRFDYLLTSSETETLRRVNANPKRLKRLYAEYKALSPFISALANGESDAETLSLTRQQWADINMNINQLVIENLVGGEAENITAKYKTDLDQLRIIRVAILAILFGCFIYFIFVIRYLYTQFVIDTLTGKFNHNYLKRYNPVENSDSYIAIEIRNSQQIQTEYGGAEADELIKLCAERLEKHMHTNDLLLHVSYGQFAIVQKNSLKEGRRESVKQLIHAANFEWKINETTVPIGLIAGIDPAHQKNGPKREWRERHQNALRALCKALEHGNDYCISDDQLCSEFDIKTKVLKELVNFFRFGSSNLKLWLVYQPIVRAAHNTEVAGAEILLRARVDDQIDVPPNTIVNICEQHGLGKELGRWIFRQAALECEHLFSVMNFKGFLSINLNPSMICKQLPDMLKTYLLIKNIPPEQICLEITENNAAIDFSENLPIIQKVRAMGIQLALDDFGTGYSSLEYLQRLPVDKLKIDRCFVTGIEDDLKRSLFLKGIIHIASSINVQTIVEGVENISQCNIVMKYNADFLQGFNYYKPAEINELSRIIFDSQSHDVELPAVIRV